MSASSIQAWVAIVGGLLTAAVGLVRYFSYQSKRDRMASVGAGFNATVESLASESEVERMAAAVLLRRFFERGTEQGGRRRPYKREAVEVIAAVLRKLQVGQEDQEREEKRDEDNVLQKVLADGLRYAEDLTSADLQRCNLRNAYLGCRPGDRPLRLSNADLYRADCTAASFRQVVADGAVFYDATLERAVFVEAILNKADFRLARLAGANFSGARIEGARFAGAVGIPGEVSSLLDENFVGVPNAQVGKAALS
jgi:hypothetical protein